VSIGMEKQLKASTKRSHLMPHSSRWQQSTYICSRTKNRTQSWR